MSGIVSKKSVRLNVTKSCEFAKALETDGHTDRQTEIQNHQVAHHIFLTFSFAFTFFSFHECLLSAHDVK